MINECIAGRDLDTIDAFPKRLLVKILRAHHLRGDLAEHEVRIAAIGAVGSFSRPPLAVPGDAPGAAGTVVQLAADAAADALLKGVRHGRGMIIILDVPVAPVRGFSVEQIKVEAPVRSDGHAPDAVRELGLSNASSPSAFAQTRFYGLMSHNRRDFSLRKNGEAEDMKRKMYARLRAARSEVTAHYG